jgi:hypothetical protein
MCPSRRSHCQNSINHQLINFVHRIPATSVNSITTNIESTHIISGFADRLALHLNNTHIISGCVSTISGSVVTGAASYLQ